jgi:hypothetical protein
VEVVIDHHFRGPAGSANGGYTCGILASLIHGPEEVTLRLPPPLDRPLEVAWEDERRRVELRDGEALVAVADVADVDVELPEPIPFETAAAAELPEGDRESAFPECFVCGWARDDGLGIYAGPAPDGDVVAATWTPRPEHVAPEFVWAALDCPGAYAVHGGARGAPVLGRLAARVEHLPQAGERCVVMAWPLGEDGRKLYAGTALYGEDGRVLGAARATWIAPR